MKGTPAIYLGRIVEKTNFRTFIYAPDGARRLVESWDEFEQCMQSGVWFATTEDAQNSAPSKPKRVRKPVVNNSVDLREPVSAAVTILESSIEVVDEDVEPLVADEGTFEVTNDDFLPKARK